MQQNSRKAVLELMMPLVIAAFRQGEQSPSVWLVNISKITLRFGRHFYCGLLFSFQ